MGRGLKFYTSNMAPNPYPAPKALQPGRTWCELCERDMATREWATHKNSKKHRKAEDKEKGDASTTNDAFFGGGSTNFDGDTANNNFTSASVDNNDEWNAVGGFDAFDDSKPTYKKTDGGGGGNGCFVCGDTTHQKRDCPQGGSGGAGSDQACFKCGETGHRKAECPQSNNSTGGSRSGRACFNCNKPGHNKSDCPEPPVRRCRNCDAEGHDSYECPQPKDWSRVKCKNCSNYGHGVKRCPEPTVEASDGWANNGNDTGATNGGWGTEANNTHVQARGDWETSAATATSDWADEATIAANGGAGATVW